MPENVIKGLAKKSNKSEAEIEKEWATQKTKYLADNDKKDLDGKDYGIITGMVKDSLGIKESLLHEFLQSDIKACDFLNEASKDKKVFGVEKENLPSKMSIKTLKTIISKKGWDSVSDTLIDLVSSCEKSNPKVAKWADTIQADLSDWIDDEREKNPSFGK